MKETEEKIPSISPPEYTAAAERVRSLLQNEAKYGALWLCVRAYLLGLADAKKQ